MLVVGMGERFAGDDGVGPAVIDALRGAQLPAGVELWELRDASALLPLCERQLPLIIIDAALGGAPGSVRCVSGEELAETALSSVSSHGVGVAGALKLAETLYGAPQVRLIAVGVEQVAQQRSALSAPVARAVPEAVNLVKRLLENP